MNLEQPLAQFCEYLAQVLKLRKQVIRTSLGVAAHAQAFRRFECLMDLEFEWPFTPKLEMRCLLASGCPRGGNSGPVLEGLRVLRLRGGGRAVRGDVAEWFRARPQAGACDLEVEIDGDVQWH